MPRHEIRRGSIGEVRARAEAFERRFGMSTAEFVARFEADEDIEGIHPHLAGLWYGAACHMRRAGREQVERLEAMLA